MQYPLSYNSIKQMFESFMKDVSYLLEANFLPVTSKLVTGKK